MRYIQFGGFDEKDEFDFLKKMNSSLTALNEQLLTDRSEDFPNIFIMGLPRSGTTFLSQLIHNSLNVCTFNNLSAKFWEAPLVGAYLSKMVVPDKKNNVSRSYYAHTDEIEEPHEFSYFWRKQLLLENSYSLIRKEQKGCIDWNRLKNTLIGLNHIYQKCGVYKTLEYTGYFLSDFYELFPKSIYIYIYRDSFSVAKSIYKARRDYSVEDWWGTVPPEYHKLKDLSLYEQIAGQVYYLEKFYEESMSKLDNDRLIRVNYSDLCAHPNTFLDKLTSRIMSQFNFEVTQINTPESSVESSSSLGEGIENELYSELNKYHKN